MGKGPSLVEIFLCPGEVFFAGEDTRIRTLLGSCVAMTIWHRQLRMGGMCHYMLPARPYQRSSARMPMDGRYGDEAVALLLREVRGTGARPSEFEAKLFGGGDMFPLKRNLDPVGLQNVAAARSLVLANGFRLVAEHLGGVGHRNVIFEIATGHVWMRQGGK